MGSTQKFASLCANVGSASKAVLRRDSTLVGDLRFLGFQTGRESEHDLGGQLILACWH